MLQKYFFYCHTRNAILPSKTLYAKASRYRKRRYYPRKAIGQSNIGAAMQTARWAWSGVKYLKGLVNSELFAFDTSQSSTAINDTGTSILMNAVPIGDNANGRTGLSILMKAIYVRATLTKHASATNSRVRCIMIIDNQQQADSTPTLSTLLGSSFSIVHPLNVENLGRFTVLYDRVYNLTTDKPNVNFKLYKKIQLHTKFNGATGSDIQKNGVYWLQFSDEDTNTPTISSYFRVRYHDN